MPTGIFLIPPSGELVEIAESSFEREADFQELLARYPNLLAGDQVNPGAPRRWLLVDREVDVPGEEGGGGWWARVGDRGQSLAYRR